MNNRSSDKIVAVTIKDGQLDAVIKQRGVYFYCVYLDSLDSLEPDERIVVLRQHAHNLHRLAITDDVSVNSSLRKLAAEFEAKAAAEEEAQKPKPTTWKLWKLAPESDPQERYILVTPDGEGELSLPINDPQVVEWLEANPYASLAQIALTFPLHLGVRNKRGYEP